MKRIVVAGGTGFFGRTIVERLRADGYVPLVGSRASNADLPLDVEDHDSLRRALRPGDVIVDAVGPFQRRTTTFIEAAIEIGCDLIDIADCLPYVRSVYALRPQIDAAGIRVYTACSSASAISAAMIRLSGIAEPIRVHGFLVPATRHTAVAGTAASLFCSVGRRIKVFDGGAIATRPGWHENASFTMPGHLGTVTGHLFETADAVTLPPVWPSLRTAKFFVDTNVRGLNFALSAAAKFPMLRRMAEMLQPAGLSVSRWLGHRASGLGYEIEDRHGNVARIALSSDEHGYITPVAPAVLVAEALARGEDTASGLIPVDRHVEPERLVDYLQRLGIALTVR